MALRRTASITAPLVAAAAVFIGAEGEKPEVGQARAQQSVQLAGIQKLASRSSGGSSVAAPRPSAAMLSPAPAEAATTLT